MDLPRSARLEAELKSRGANLAGIQPLAGDGSDRRFFRVPGKPSLVLLYHPRPPGGRVTENDSYVLIGRHLGARGVPVPEIYLYCREEGWMLLEDVGDLSLAEAAAGAGDSEVLAWYHQALNILVNQQIAGKQGFSPAWCFDTPAVTGEFLLERECLYFVRAFVQGYLGFEVDESALWPDFERLLAGCRPEESPYFLHRDFQSKNLFIHGGKLRVLDFQGARLGPLGYDLAALLIDPYVDLEPARQDELLEAYLELLGNHIPVDRPAFREQYDHLALCRNLQILGAFAFLTRVKGKSQFVGYIPRAWAGLQRRLAARAGDFPRLAALAERISV